MRWYRADLHIHTCLSPCGSLDMTPSRIVEKAVKEKLEIIGICDHNSAGNILYVKRASEKKGVKCFPGMEVTSAEEVHILSIFRDIESAMKLEEIVHSGIKGKNVEDVFGIQVVVDEKDEVVRIEDKLLIGSSALSLEDLINTIHSLGGIAIAAHIDREAFSIIGKLGFIPEGLPLDGIEVSPNALNRINEFKKSGSVVAFSDAHSLEVIGSVWTAFYLAEPTFEDLKSALQDARRVRING